MPPDPFTEQLWDAIAERSKTLTDKKAVILKSDVFRLLGLAYKRSCSGATVKVSERHARCVHELVERVERPRVLESLTVEAFAQHVRTCSNVVVMCGAGISVAAGIPDFRTPHVGLYSQLEQFALPSPRAMFDLEYFRRHPHAFYNFLDNLWPGANQPTAAHRMLRTLGSRGLLRRVYTQNIDGLEIAAGLSPLQVVQSHGSMDQARCIDCKRSYTTTFVRTCITKKRLPLCNICRGNDDVVPLLPLGEGEPEGDEGNPHLSGQKRQRDDDEVNGGGTEQPTCCSSSEQSWVDDEAANCIKGLVKPCVVLFGEELPERFHASYEDDLLSADALIIMGTSLQVEPFSQLPYLASPRCPRLLINLDTADVARRAGFVLDSDYAYRDVVWQGDAQDGARAFIDALGSEA